MKTRFVLLALAITASVTVGAAPTVGASPPPDPPSIEPVAAGIQGAGGSAIGPDGALYVTENQTGRILRIDRNSGATSVYAVGLPTATAPIGGPMDLVFVGDQAYVLVSLVGDFFGNDAVNGIYRMDGPSDWTVIADLGQWALDHPPGPEIDYFIPTGVHYAIERYRNGFIVSDAHHNKVLRVSKRGTISEVRVFGNVVPAGLETHGRDILLALTGPAPHLPEDGRIVSFSPRGDEVETVAAGGPLMLDVERGRGDRLFGLAQGHFTPGQLDGSPADPFTGELLRVGHDGEVSVVVGGLNQPTSMEIVGNDAWVVGLDGTVVRISGIGGRGHHHGHGHGHD